MIARFIFRYRVRILALNMSLKALGNSIALIRRINGASA